MGKNIEFFGYKKIKNKNEAKMKHGLSVFLYIIQFRRILKKTEVYYNNAKRQSKKKKERRAKKKNIVQFVHIPLMITPFVTINISIRFHNFIICINVYHFLFLLVLHSRNKK